MAWTLRHLVFHHLRVLFANLPRRVVLTWRLMPEPRPREVSDGFVRVPDDVSSRGRLVEAGKRSARAYDWNRRLDGLERLYESMARR